ncbi:MAG: aminopeptidase P family protein [Catenulispora sp.]|nr:aminopeptidase P family protein [Catenulispora sp.]
MSNKTGRTPPGPEALERHREAQALAYRCAETVGAGLEAGVTERETARRMRRFLRDNGVEDFFHIPFAWFGERTAFRAQKGPWTPLHFFPTNKRLEDGMSYVLDCSPVVDGYVADIGYAGVLGENRIFEALMRDLAEYRTLIPERIKAGDTLAEVYAAVDTLIARQGYESRHKVYPGRVIGHQVGHMSQRRAVSNFMVGRYAFGFGLRTLETLGREIVTEGIKGRSPLWADGRASRHAPTPGLWAVEPHIGFRDVGVKFEELLVVTEDDAYWLDDDLPHVRRWQSAAATEGAYT